MSPRRTWHARLTLPLLLILLTLALCEGLLRAWYRFAPPQNTNLLPARKSMLHIFAATEGSSIYSVKPNYRQTVVNHEFTVEVRTNNIGLREDSDYHGEPVDVAFIGDSFTFGWGVEAGERYSDVVAAAFPGKRVLSYSYPNGHSPINYLAFLQRHPEMMPEVLVLGLFAFNDLAADTADAIVVYGPGPGEILNVGSRTYAVDPRGFIYDKSNPPPRPLSWQGLVRGTAIGRTLRVARYQLANAGKPASNPSELKPLDRGELDETAQLALQHILAIDELARTHNTDFMVFYIPFASEIGDYPVCRYAETACAWQRQNNPLGETLALWAEENRIHFIDPVTRFRKLEAVGQQLYFPLDAHWTPAGHAAAGRMIIDYLRQEYRLLIADG